MNQRTPRRHHATLPRTLLSLALVGAHVIASLSAAEFQPTYDLAKLPGTAPDAPDIKFYGEPSPSGSQFGNVVRTGDFNGDGIQDLAIADLYVERSVPDLALVGAVYDGFGRSGFAV